MKSEATRGRLRVNMHLKPKISLLNTQTEKPSKLISCLLFLGVRYRRFHGRGRHLVGRAKNSDRLGRVTFSLVIENGGEQVRVR